MIDELLYIGAGIVTGAVQTHLVRKYLDPGYVTTTNPTGELIAIGGFGKPSTLAGVGIGGVAVGYSATRKKMGDVDFFLFGHGVSAAASGVISAMSCKEPAAATGMNVRRVVVQPQYMPQYAPQPQYNGTRGTL